LLLSTSASALRNEVAALRESSAKYDEFAGEVRQQYNSGSTHMQLGQDLLQDRHTDSLRKGRAQQAKESAHRDAVYAASQLNGWETHQQHARGRSVEGIAATSRAPVLSATVSAPSLSSLGGQPRTQRHDGGASTVADGMGGPHLMLDPQRRPPPAAEAWAESGEASSNAYGAYYDPLGAGLMAP